MWFRSFFTPHEQVKEDRALRLSTLELHVSGVNFGWIPGMMHGVHNNARDLMAPSANPAGQPGASGFAIRTTSSNHLKSSIGKHQ